MNLATLLLLALCAPAHADSGPNLLARHRHARKFLAENHEKLRLKLMKCEITGYAKNELKKYEGAVDFITDNSKPLAEQTKVALETSVQSKVVKIPPLPGGAGATGMTSGMARLTTEAKPQPPTFAPRALTLAQALTGNLAGASMPVSAEIHSAYHRISQALGETKNFEPFAKKQEETAGSAIDTSDAGYDCGRDLAKLATELDRRKLVHSRLADRYHFAGQRQIWGYLHRDYAKALDGKTLSEAKDCQDAEDSVMATVRAINQIVETLDGLIVYNSEQAEALGSQSAKLESARARCATAGK